MDHAQTIEELKAWLSDDWGGGLVFVTDVLEKINELEEEYK